MKAEGDPFDDDDVARPALIALSLAAFTVYLAAAAFSTIIFPGALLVFLAPLALVALAAMPQGKAAPKKLVMPLLYASVFLMPIWPVYIHLKLGPAPIITPPRLFLYALSAIWMIDMVSSPLRRAQFISGLKRGGAVSFFVLAFFAMSILSAPMAEGRSLAVQELFRQLIIWLVPFCIAVTYVRRPREFRRVLLLLAAAAIINAVIAVTEKATGRLLASVLSPFITGNAEWLQMTQMQKIRDGVFRAQGTHTHPLSVGEFIALMTPFAVVYAMRTKSFMTRWMWAAAAGALILGALATSSRGALVATIVSLGAMAVMLVYRYLTSANTARFKPLVGFALLIAITTAPITLTGAKKYIGGEGGASASRSSQARLDQIEMAWPKILKRPVTGYGSGRSARILGYYGRALSIDNYYLSTALDLGFPGPIIFGGLMIALALSAFRRMREGPPRDQLIYVAFLAAVISFATTRTIVSMGGNFSFMHILFGAFAGAAPFMRKNRRRRDRQF
ncbi:MAG: O-antigen ligase family protein [Pseudomonadota bacterium]